ncbi:hypothetical protein [Oceanicoccus sp. KOV_DT_Chl]|uniref:hypothetical protein n=1 Tax=Oceanicoccus sp. KOV_DT_Chl TaxID=1904639 RepID=UPI000C79DC00|nr:hypothetical protein [Oceanicoccus sp. KOV_DT_Chl]
MEYLLLKFAHIVAFVYWLGGDLGTFFGSKYVIQSQYGQEARTLALKIMLACDQGPKMAMPLIFPLGLHMASISGMVAIPGWLLGLVWLLALLWLANVLFLYFTSNAAAKAKVARFDFWFRITVVIAITAYSVVGLLDSSLIQAQFLPFKMLIFSTLVGFGLLVRIALKDFMPAYAQLVQSGATEQVNKDMTRSMKLAKPWVWGIWAGLFANALIGVHVVNDLVGMSVLLLLTLLTPLPLLLIARKRYC